MVVSIGMLPPIPNPQKAVTTRKDVYESHAPRPSPKAAEIKQVKLNAHRRPTCVLVCTVSRSRD